MEWKYKEFTELSAAEIHEILKLRQDVFIIEQTCIYPDIDGKDEASTHLFAVDDENSICAYMRIIAPGLHYQEAALGRILTVQTSRGTGLGKALIEKGIETVAQEFPGQSIKISAQEHLERFYQGFGFVTSSKPYDDDGIMHIDMIRKAS